MACDTKIYEHFNTFESFITEVSFNNRHLQFKLKSYFYHSLLLFKYFASYQLLVTCG